jgi:hypothetical protein
MRAMYGFTTAGLNVMVLGPSASRNWTNEMLSGVGL